MSHETPAADLGFSHLHVHGMYSLLDGCIKTGDLVNRAKELNMAAVALTDHGNMFGAMEFYSKAKAAGIKPILGCEVYVAATSRFTKNSNEKSGGAGFHFVLLCENLQGYRNLCHMVSVAYKEGFYRRPRVDWELLQEYNEGLIALTGCLGGEVPQLILDNQMDAARQRLKEMAVVFDQNRLYLELQENFMTDQEKANKGLIQLAAELNLPLVATNDCHYLSREDAHAHEVLLCIQTGKTMDDPTHMKFPNDEFYFKSAEEMSELFKHVPEAVANTGRIAARCNVEIDLDTYHFPQFAPPEGMTLDDLLREQTAQGLTERFEEIRRLRPEFSADDEQTYRERVEVELECIQKMGFPGYFLIVADFINWAKNNGVPVGPGRGSAAGSLVAYSIRITDIDPIPYDLLFERFLNPERVSMPDIDVDFCIYGRESVIDYVREKYGADKVAQIITFGSMLAKGVIRDVGRALNIQYSEVDKIAKMIPDQATLKDAIKLEPKIKDMIESNTQVAELFKVGLALEGLTRHASTHAAGVVVTPNPLTDYLPLYVDQKTGSQTTQYAMNEVEKNGLVKFDFLGLKTLTVIDNAVKFVRGGKDPQFDVNLIPENDPKTYQMISNGETTGVFQLESSGMREMLCKLQPNAFEDLIAAVALYRPGPLGSGMVDTFIRRKHGKEKVAYDFPQLEPILKDTCGIIVYQEQVMLIAQVLGSYSLAGADLLRRAMGKKKPEEMAKQKEIFLKGAAENQLDASKAEAVFNLMEKFAEYGFNKSHSAAYARIAYHTAYLKAHYPVEFMAALLTEDMENTDKVLKNMNDVRAMGIEILPPDINASNRSFTVAAEVIRFGMGAIKGVGAAALDSIVENRSQEGNFVSLQDLCERVDLRKANKKVLEALIKSGALDSLGGKRSQYMMGLEDVVLIAQKVQKERNSGQASLFETEEIVSHKDKNFGTLPDVPEWQEKERLRQEKEVLGFYLSGHPLQKELARIKKMTTCDLAGLADRENGKEVRVCGIFAGIKEITTRKGDRMAFGSLEDLSGSAEVVIFTDIYVENRDLIKSEEPVLVKGRLDIAGDVCKVVASEIVSLKEEQGRTATRAFFKLDGDQTSDEKIRALRDLLHRHPGSCSATIVITVPNKSRVTLALPDKVKVAASEALMIEAEQLLGENSIVFD